MESSSKTVLITGAGGFIGSNTVKRFHSEGFKITAIVHKYVAKELMELDNIEFIYADITNPKQFYNSIKDIKADIIVHAAGLAKDIGTDKEFRKCNFEPIKTLAKLDYQKLIYISSTDVYGIKDFYGADERTRFEKHPINPYQKYKIETEKWINKNISPDKYVIIRPAAVWGEADKTLESRVIEYLNKSDFIIHFGKWKGKNRWPMANVETVADAIYKTSVCDTFNGSALNIIDSEFTTIDEYYRMIAKKYFPHKKFKTLYLPYSIGIILGCISTNLSNIFRLKKPLFEPTAYSLRHVSSNLDFKGREFSKPKNNYQL